MYVGVVHFPYGILILFICRLVRHIGWNKMNCTIDTVIFFHPKFTTISSDFLETEANTKFSISQLNYTENNILNRCRAEFINLYIITEVYRTPLNASLIIFLPVSRYFLWVKRSYILDDFIALDIASRWILAANRRLTGSRFQ